MCRQALIEAIGQTKTGAFVCNGRRNSNWNEDVHWRVGCMWIVHEILAQEERPSQNKQRAWGSEAAKVNNEPPDNGSLATEIDIQWGHVWLRCGAP